MTKSSPSHLYVVIPTCGRPDLLARTLHSLSACSIPDSFRGVWVAENGPEQGARTVVEKAPPRLQATYLHVPQKNKSRALNVVLQQMSDDLIFFADDDVRFDPGVLSAYGEAAARHPRGYFGGPVGVDYEEAPPDWLFPYLPTSAKGWEGPLPGRKKRPFALYGCNWAACSRDLQKVGGFDEQRGPGTELSGQETDMQYRLRTSGIPPIFVPEARVWHYVPADRCSPEWAIARARRHAYWQGLGLARRPGFKSTLRWMWWCVHPRTFAGRCVALLDKREQTRFRRTYWNACRQAVLEGASKNE